MTVDPLLEESRLAVTRVLLAGVMLAIAAPVLAQGAPSDTMPAAVVQRFVDAANARQLDALMSTVAPSATFAGLPEGGRSLVGRDSVRAHYARVLARIPAGYTVTVAARIVDGAFVTDHELFPNADGSAGGRATWVYYVTGGQIQRAWTMRQPRPQRP